MIKQKSYSCVHCTTIKCTVLGQVAKDSYDYIMIIIIIYRYIIIYLFSFRDLKLQFSYCSV